MVNFKFENNTLKLDNIIIIDEKNSYRYSQYGGFKPVPLCTESKLILIPASNS